MKNFLKNSFLKNSGRYDFLDSTICCASFPGFLILGQLETDSNSQSRFSDDKAVVIKECDLVSFVAAIRRGFVNYEANKNDEFELDIEPPKRKESLYKLCALFSRVDEQSDYIFQLRYKWLWSKDKAHAQRVKEGTATEITDENPWKFLKRGIICSFDCLQSLLEVIEQHILVMFSNDIFNEEIISFVEFATNNFADKIRNSTLQFHLSKPKDRNSLLDEVLLAWSKIHPEMVNDGFKIKQFKDSVLTKHNIVYSLFNYYL